MRKFLVAMAAFGLIAAATSPVFSQGPSIEGVWLGTSTETIGGPNASKNMKRLHNIHIYTKGYWMVLAQAAAVPLPPRKPLPPMKTPGKPTDAEKLAAYDLWAPVIAQAGRYEIKGNTVTQHLDVTKGVGGGPNTLEVRLEDGGKTLIETVKGPNFQTIRRYTRLE